MNAMEDLSARIVSALCLARQEKASHVVLPGDPPSHVRGRHMAIVVTHLEDALARCRAASPQAAINSTRIYQDE